MTTPASPLENPASPSDPEVSWQTLFWIITTLALNSMTQPSGRVCGLSTRYRIYLRSSPLMCLLDIVLTVGRIVDIWITQPGISLCQSWHVVLHERFREEYPTARSGVDVDTSQPAGNGNGPRPGPGPGPGSEPGSGTATGSSSSLRWLLFIMGPLPQAIRLASFKGVFWSKCIGFSFLFPWVLCEILIFLYSRMRTQQHTSPDLAFLATVKLEPRSLDDDDRVLFVAMMHYIPIFVLVYVTLVVCELSGWVMTIALMLYTLPLMVFAGLVCLLIISLGALFRRFPWVGRVMLVACVERVKDRDVVVVDDKAFSLLLVFLVNFLICSVGYAYFYDEAGTVNPGWTGVFG